jgi:stage V sporulation protein R
VESFLDAAHALSLQCRRNFAIRKLAPDEQEERVLEQAHPRSDPFHNIHRRSEFREPDLRKVPLEPEDDLLLFIRDHNPLLAEWEKDLLTIVHEQALYFIPQIETKIMNEGWASYWHREIMNSLELPQDMHMEFLVKHNQVVCPHPGGINPYHLGVKLWEYIRHRYDDPTPEEIEKYGAPEKCGLDKMFEIREVDRDVSFLRRFLTEELTRSLDLFEYRPQGQDLVVSEVSDERSWRQVKETLLNNVGMSATPVVKVIDADYGQSRGLYVKHEHDGRDLQLEFASKTMSYVHQLWGRNVLLETLLNGKPVWFSYTDRGFAVKESR